MLLNYIITVSLLLFVFSLKNVEIVNIFEDFKEYNKNHYKRYIDNKLNKAINIIKNC